MILTDEQRKARNREYNRSWREKNREHIREIQANYRERHREKIRASQIKWVEENRGKNKAQKRKWYEANKDAVCEQAIRYWKNHPAEKSAHCAKRRAAKILRTPAWADREKIKFWYECKPKGCHVDHIIPLNGELVSGLHVETNLQWMPAKMNSAKGNKYDIGI